MSFFMPVPPETMSQLVTEDSKPHPIVRPVRSRGKDVASIFIGIRSSVPFPLIGQL
jgi:hypothetical protein